MRFGITFDYLCPFTRNANEAVMNGVEAGKDWQPRYMAFSLVQVHLTEGEPNVWDQPGDRPGVLALQWGIAARDHLPDSFPTAHRALFSARHDHGKDITDETVIRGALDAAGIDTDALAAVVATGAPLEALADEHTEAVDQWQVFGVPTFLCDDHATFVRFMNRGDVDDLELALGLLPRTGLNEFKRTTVPQ